MNFNFFFLLIKINFKLPIKKNTNLISLKCIKEKIIL